MKKLSEITETINKEIVLVWLQKIEKLSPEERAEMIKIVHLLNNPMYVTTSL